MRLTFPQDRVTFVHQGPMEPILTPPRTGIALYADEHGLTLADVLGLDKRPLAGSTIHTGDDGLLPEFLGPVDGTRVLWAKVLGTAVLYPLQARASDILAAVVEDLYVEAAPPSLISGPGRPSASVGTQGAFYLDLTAVPAALWGPRSAVGWPSAPLPLAPEVPEPPRVPAAIDYEIRELTTEIVLDHDLHYPSVVFRDVENEETDCEVAHLTPTRVAVRFGFPSTGSIHLSP